MILTIFFDSAPEERSSWFSTHNLTVQGNEASSPTEILTFSNIISISLLEKTRLVTAAEWRTIER